VNFSVTRACIYDFIHEVIGLQLFIREGPGVGLAMRSVALRENRTNFKLWAGWKVVGANGEPGGCWWW